MLKAHMREFERSLLATSRIPANSGHSLHKGTPRESFIKTYLENHLPSTVAIGTGEIIDAQSKPGDTRNQHDIVIYQRSYPKLDFGSNVSGFLIESVIATIEVKSTLTQEDFGNAALSASKCKQLKPSVTGSLSTGYSPPKALNYVVAYDGPASMKTVYGWTQSEYPRNGIQIANLPLTPESRLSTPSPALDGVFVLGRGFMYYDNVPVGFISQETRRQLPGTKWVLADTEDGALLVLFLLLQQATASLAYRTLNPTAYLSGVAFTVAVGE